MNVVAMARHGPILKDNEATGSGKVFKYLPGLRDTTKKSKMAAKAQKSKNTVFYRIFNIGGRRHGRSPITIIGPLTPIGLGWGYHFLLNAVAQRRARTALLSISMAQVRASTVLSSAPSN